MENLSIAYSLCKHLGKESKFASRAYDHYSQSPLSLPSIKQWERLFPYARPGKWRIVKGTIYSFDGVEFDYAVIEGKEIPTLRRLVSPPLC